MRSAAKFKKGGTFLEYLIIACGIAIFCTFGILMFGKTAESQAQMQQGNSGEVVQSSSPVTVIKTSFGIEATSPFGAGQIISIVPTDIPRYGSIAITYRDSEGRVCLKVLGKNSGKIYWDIRFEDDLNLK